MAIGAASSTVYAQRFGWDVILSAEDLARGRPTSWAKVPFLAALLETYELVLWLDADALFVCLDRDLAACASDGRDVYLAEHQLGVDPPWSVPNAGVMLVRSSPGSRALFDAVWSRTEFIEHPWWDNIALLAVLGFEVEPPFRRINASPFTRDIGNLDLAWNSVPGYCSAERPMIHHHARADHDSFGRRARMMLEDAQRVLDAHHARSGRRSVDGASATSAD